MPICMACMDSLILLSGSCLLSLPNHPPWGLTVEPGVDMSVSACHMVFMLIGKCGSSLLMPPPPLLPPFLGFPGQRVQGKEEPLHTNQFTHGE